MAPAPHTPPSRNVIIALVDDHPKTILLLRMARKRAQERDCKWRAIFIETPAHQKQVDDGPRERMLRLLTIAEQMGGESEQFEALSVEKGVEQILTREAPRLELVIIGSTESGRFARFKTLPWMRTVHSASQHAQVEIVPLAGPSYRQPLRERLPWKSLHPLHIVYALLGVGAAALCAMGLEYILPPALFRINEHNVALLFMTVCAFVAGRYGLLPGLVASIGSFLTVNYYFTVPYYVLKIGTVTDLLNMAIFLSAGLLVSLFTSQTRGYAENATKRELSTQALFTLYRISSESFSRQQAIEKLHRRLERMLDVDVAFFLPPVLSPDRIEAVAPGDLKLDDADQKALESCWRDMKITGIGAAYNPGTKWRFEPMISSGGEIGVIAVRPRAKTRMDAWFGRLLTALADQTANVLEHIELERSMEANRIREEREKLRSMLLSSVSHDLKTPLAGIIGAISVHQSLGKRLSEEKRNELLESSLEEAQRLDSFITNILDMTRLESGNIKFKQDWHYVAGMIDDVRKRLKHRLKKRQLIVHPFPPNLEIFTDAVMTQQVLQNILDNACKYTPEDSAIEITCTASDEKGFACSVRDHGGGLPPDKIGVVFDKYARLHKQDSQVAGTGLGLSIAKMVMEAQHGSITADNYPDGGAIFTFRLPQWRVQALALPEEKYAALE